MRMNFGFGKSILIIIILQSSLRQAAGFCADIYRSKNVYVACSICQPPEGEKEIQQHCFGYECTILKQSIREKHTATYILTIN